MPAPGAENIRAALFARNVYQRSGSLSYTEERILARFPQLSSGDVDYYLFRGQQIIEQSDLAREAFSRQTLAQLVDPSLRGGPLALTYHQIALTGPLGGRSIRTLRIKVPWDVSIDTLRGRIEEILERWRKRYGTVGADVGEFLSVLF